MICLINYNNFLNTVSWKQIKKNNNPRIINIYELFPAQRCHLVSHSKYAYFQCSDLLVAVLKVIKNLKKLVVGVTMPGWTKIMAVKWIDNSKWNKKMVSKIKKNHDSKIQVNCTINQNMGGVDLNDSHKYSSKAIPPKNLLPYYYYLHCECLDVYQIK